MIYQSYKLNLIPDQVPLSVWCSQYDADSRIFQFEIYKGSELYTIPGGSTVTVRGTKQDNTGFEYSCTYDGSVANVIVKDQMTIFAGKVPCEVRIANGSDILGTANFNLMVERTPLDTDVTISETDLPLLEEAEQNAIRAEAAASQAATVLASAVKSVNDVLPDANGNVTVQTSSPLSAGTGISISNDTVTNTAPIWHGDEVGDLPVPINADQLEGHDASYFQQALTEGSGIEIANNTISFHFNNLSSGTDLNNITYNYLGYVPSATNSPSGYASGMLLVVASPAGSNCMQIFHFYNGAYLFVRYYRQATGWGTWKEITLS